MYPRAFPLLSLLVCLVPLCAAIAVREPDASNPTPTGSGPSCAQTAPTIPNGDFESGSLEPWKQITGPHSNGTASVVSPGYDSDYALQLTGSWFFSVTQDFLPACEATNYSVTFDYQLVEASSTCEIRIGGSREVGFVVPLEATGWTSATFSIPLYIMETLGIKVVVDCKHAGSAVLLVDNFAVTTSSSLEPAGCPRVASFPNGGFESASLAHWQIESITDAPAESFTAPGYNSDYALQLDYPTVDSTAIEWTMYTYVQDLCLAYEYTITAAFNWGNYSAPPTGQNGGCYVAMGLDSCAEASPYFWEPPAVPNSGWQNISITCRSSASLPTRFNFDLTCEVINEAPIPAFTFLLDDFAIDMIA